MYVYYFIIVQNKAVIAFIIIINLKYTMSKNVSLQMSVLFGSGLNNNNNKKNSKNFHNINFRKKRGKNFKKKKIPFFPILRNDLDDSDFQKRLYFQDH